MGNGENKITTMRELVVTPNGNYAPISSDDMLFNLQQAQASANARNRKTKAKIVSSMNLRIHPFFRNAMITSAAVPAVVAGAPYIATYGPTLAVGALGGNVVNEGMKKTFGYTWGEGINLLSRGYIPAWLGDFTNPGYAAAALAKPLEAAISLGKSTFNSLKDRFLKNPLPSYELEDILKSDFYKLLVADYGEKKAKDMTLVVSSPEFRNYFLKGKSIIKANNKHIAQMNTIKEVENAGGLLSGSARLALEGTVNRKGLLHDLDFNVPGNMIEGTTPVLENIKGWSPLTYRKTLPITGTTPVPNTNLIKGKDYTTYPIKVNDYNVDLFIRDNMPTKELVPQVILDAKKIFNRRKDVQDLAAFKPYSATNPMIDVTTGTGLWNPTLFNKGFLTSEGYPMVVLAEVFPGSGVRVPIVMNSLGQIRTIPKVIKTVLPNGKIRLTLPSHTRTNPREFVLEPSGNNKFYVHMRTWDGDHIPANMSLVDKQTLFDALYNELSEGAEILFPKSGSGYYATRGTVAGLLRLARDPRFTPGTKGTLYYLDKDGKTIKTFEGTSFIKTLKITPENATGITPEL